MNRRALLGGLAVSGFAATKAKKEEEEVSPAEDLMREHGVLKRALLIYRESIRRIAAHQDLPPDVVSGAADLIRRFIEQYHEKTEEDFLFPRFRKAGKLVELVDVLELQHKKGREVTGRILALAAGKDPRQLAEQMHAFVRMYEPHEAREDTVLFPAFHRLVSQHEYDALGEQFEKREHQMFGADGFELCVGKVAELEKRLGIYDLRQFTPA